MNILITGHHPLEVTEAMKTKINEKVGKLTKYFSNITEIHITLSIEHLSHKAVANVQLAKGKLSAHAESKDMYDTIDRLVDVLHKQITKYKEKLKDHGEHSHEEQPFDSDET